MKPQSIKSFLPSLPKRSTPSSVKRRAGQKPVFKNGADNGTANATAAKQAFKVLWETQSGGKHNAARVHKGAKGDYITTGRHSFGSFGDVSRDSAAKQRARDRYYIAVHGIQEYSPSMGNYRVRQAASRLLPLLEQVHEVRKDNKDMRLAMKELYAALQEQDDLAQFSRDRKKQRQATSERSDDTGDFSDKSCSDSGAKIIVEQDIVEPNKSATTIQSFTKPAPAQQDSSTESSAPISLNKPAEPEKKAQQLLPENDAPDKSKDAYFGKDDKATQRQAVSVPVVLPRAASYMRDALRLLSDADALVDANLYIDPVTKTLNASREVLGESLNSAHRQLTLRFEAIGLMHTEFPDAEVSAAAGKVLAIARKSLDEGVPLRGSDELLDAMTVIARKCHPDMPQSKALYGKLEELYGATSGPMTMARLQAFNAEEWHAARSYDYSECNQVGAANLFRYLKHRPEVNVPMNAPVFLQRLSDSATTLATKASVRHQPRFEDDEEPFVEEVQYDAAKDAAEMVDRYGKRFETHSDPRVAEAARWLRETAAPVLASKDTPRVHLVGSPEMADAFATIAIHGLPEDSQAK